MSMSKQKLTELAQRYINLRPPHAHRNTTNTLAVLACLARREGWRATITELAEAWYPTYSRKKLRVIEDKPTGFRVQWVGMAERRGLIAVEGNELVLTPYGAAFTLDCLQNMVEVGSLCNE